MKEPSHITWTPESQAAVDAALARVTPTVANRVAPVLATKALIDMTGKIICGGATVTGQVEGKHKAAKWHVLLLCGHSRVYFGGVLREYERRGYEIPCISCDPATVKPHRRRPTFDVKARKICVGVCGESKGLLSFPPDKKQEDGRASECWKCRWDRGEYGAKRRSARTADDNGKFCKKCCGLPWQRKQPICSVCHEPYEAEAEVHVDVEARREGGAVWPEW